MTRSSHRRTVKRAMTRDKATEVRRRIEQAQHLLNVGSSDRVKLARAQQTLDTYGVTTHEKVTQSQHRFARFWRVYADAS